MTNEEAQDLLNNEEKLKAKVVQLLSAMRWYGNFQRDKFVLDILSRITEEEWLGYARNNLKKKIGS